MATRAFEFDLDAARREDGGGAFEFDLDRARASERMEAAPTLEKLAAPPTMIETAGDYIREGAGALGDAAAAVRDWMPAPVRGTLGAVSTLPATVGSQLTEGGRQLQRRAWDKAIAAEEQRLGRALSTMEALALLPGVGTLGREAFDPERESSVGGVLEAAANIGTDPTVAATGGARAGLGALGASVARTAPNAGRLATAAGGAANVLGSAAVGSVYLPDLAEGVARGVENADPASAMGMAALGGLLAKGAGVEAREVGSALARRFRGDSGAPAASPGAAVRPEAPEPEAPVQQAPEPAPAPTPEPRAAEAQGDDLALAQQFAQENDAAQARPGAFRIAEDRVADLTDRMAEASDPAEIARLAEARKVYADFVAREADRGFTLDDLEADLDGEPARAAEPAPAPRAVEPEPEPEQGFTAGRRPTLEEINAGTVGLDDIRGRMEALRQRRAAEAPTPEGMRQADEEARIEAAVPPKPEAPAARPVVNDRPIVPLDYNGAVELRMWHKPKLDRAEKVTTLEGVAELEAIRADIQARLDATLKARTRNAATKRQRQDAANLLVKELDAYKTAIRQAKTRTTKAGIAAGTIAPKPPRVEKAQKWYEQALQTPEGERTTLQRRMLGDLEASKPDDPLDGHLVAEIPGLMKNGKPRVNALDNGPTGYEAVQDKTAKQVAAAIAEDKNNPTYLELRESFADAMERRGADPTKHPLESRREAERVPDPDEWEDSGDPRYSIRRPGEGQRGLFSADDDVPVAKAKPKGPQQTSMFRTPELLVPSETKVTEGREADGPLFTQERDAADRAAQKSQKPLFKISDSADDVRMDEENRQLAEVDRILDAVSPHRVRFSQAANADLEAYNPQRDPRNGDVVAQLRVGDEVQEIRVREARDGRIRVDMDAVREGRGDAAADAAGSGQATVRGVTLTTDRGELAIVARLGDWQQQRLTLRHEVYHAAKAAAQRLGLWDAKWDAALDEAFGREAGERVRQGADYARAREEFEADAYSRWNGDPNSLVGRAWMAIQHGARWLYYAATGDAEGMGRLRAERGAFRAVREGFRNQGATGGSQAADGPRYAADWSHPERVWHPEEPRRSTKDLVDHAQEMSSWRDWYERHQGTVAKLFGDDAALFLDILSATSQATGVAGNVSLALKGYRQLKKGHQFRGYLGAVAKNLERVRSGGDLAGAKIAEFGDANRGGEDGIAVDRHIAQLLFDVKMPNAAQRRVAKAMIREAAKELSWQPREVQAALWAYNQVRTGTDPAKVRSYDTILEERADEIRRLRSRVADQRGAGARVPQRGGTGPQSAAGGADGPRGSEEARYSVDTPPPASAKKSKAEEYLAGLTSGRAWKPAIDTVRKYAPELADRLERYNHAWEVRSSRDMAAYMRALNKLGPAGEAREKLFREQVVPLLEREEQGDFRDASGNEMSPVAREVAQDIRTLLDGLADRAKRQGVLTGYRKRYFPHMAADEDFRTFESMVRRFMASKKLTDYDKAVAMVNEIRAEQRKRQTGGRMYGNTEQSREGMLVNVDDLAKKYNLTPEQVAKLLPNAYRTDTDVISQYILGANRRVAETAFLGKRHQKAEAAYNKIEDQQALAAVRKVVERMTGTEAVDPEVRRWSEGLRKAQAFTKLGIAFPLQLGSVVQTAQGLSSLGAKRAVQATAQEVWKSLSGGRGLEGLKEFRKNLDAAKLDVMDSGAIFTALAEETADAWGSKGAKRWMPHLRIIGGIDAAQRVIAARVLREVLPEWVEKARAGDVGSQRDLAALKVPWQTIDARNVDDPHVKNAMKRFADETQLRTGVADMPVWASSQVGKVVVQFLNFPYRMQVGVINPALKAARNGDYRKLAMLVALGASFGEVPADLRAAIQGKSVTGEEEIDTRDVEWDSPSTWLDLIGQVFKKATRAERIRPNSAAGATARALQNVATIGGYGLLESIFGRISRGSQDPLGVVAGPTGSSVSDLVLEPIAAASDRGPAAGARQLARGVVRSVPGYGAQIQNEIESSAIGEALGYDRKDRPGKPGLVGRVRDLVSPPSGNEMTREQVREVERERDRLKRISDRVPKGLPKKSGDARLKEATARAKKEAALQEIVELLKQGRNSEARRLINRTRANGLNVTDKKIKERLEQE